MSRQTVHLSESAAAAREVGRRHAADPVVFVVDATAMQSETAESSSAEPRRHD